MESYQKAENARRVANIEATLVSQNEVVELVLEACRRIQARWTPTHELIDIGLREGLQCWIERVPAGMAPVFFQGGDEDDLRVTEDEFIFWVEQCGSGLSEAEYDHLKSAKLN